MRYLLAAIVCLLAAQAPAFGSHLLFVFPASDSRALVVDSESLARVAEMDTGANAYEALALSASAGVSHKFYVVASGAVAVFDADFRPLARIVLPASPATAGPAAALIAKGSRLAVAAGSELYLIDTASDIINTTIETGFRIAGAAAGSDGAVLLLNAEAPELRRLEAGASALSEEAFPLAQAAALTAASGGRPMLAMERGLLDLAKADPVAFAASRAAEPSASNAPLPRVATNAAGEPVWAIDGFLHSAFGDPRSRLEPFAAAAGIADFVAAPDGKTVYAAYQDGRLVRFDKSAGAPARPIELGFAPGSLSLVSVEPAGQQQPIIEKISPDPFVPENSEFELLVNGPSGGVPLLVTESSPLVDCTPPEGGLNLLTTISCEAFDVVSPTIVEVTVDAGSTLGSVVFLVRIFPEGLPDGLTPISGNNQQVAPGTQFQLAVEYRRNGQPAPAETLSVAVQPGAPVTCPALISTNSVGVATVTCSTGGPNQNTNALITISDGQGAQAGFTITVLASDNQTDGLTKITAEPITVLGGDNFNLTVEARLNNAPQPNLQLSVTATAGLLNCPSPAATGGNGRATIICGASEVNQSTVGTVRFSDGVRSVTFTVEVVAQAQADGIFKVGGDNQFVQRNTPFPLPFSVIARVNGQPQANLTVRPTVLQNGPAICFNALTDSNGIGRIFCNALNVTADTIVRVNVRDDTGREIAEPFQATITPQPVGNASELELLSPEDISVLADSTLESAIRVLATDVQGQPVPGALVFFRSNDPAVAFEANPVVTDSSGRAEIDVTFNCAARNGTIEVGLAEGVADAVVNYQIVPGSFAELAILQGDEQTGAPGERLPLALLVRAQDACGNPLRGIPVTWAVNPAGAGTLELTVSLTDVTGRASTLVRIGGAQVQPFSVTATSGDQVAVFQVDVENIPVNLVALSGGGQQIPALSQGAQPLAVRVTNANNQPTPGVPVEFEVIEGAASLVNPSTQTNAQGEGRTLIVAEATLGAVTIEARAIDQVVRFTVFVIGRTPQVTTAGFTNAASFRTGLTPGSAGSVFGAGLSEGVQGVRQAPFPFPTEFLGVEVRIGGIPAPIFALVNQNGQEQINFQTPFELATPFGAGPPAAVTVEIVNNGSSTTITGVPVNIIQPGIFEITAGNQRVAAALHLDFTVVTPENPARPGEILALFVTGLGPIDPALETNVPGPVDPLAVVSGDVIVGMDDAGIPQLGAFYAPLLISVYQINFQVPDDAPSGLRRLRVRIGNSSSQDAFLPVQR